MADVDRLKQLRQRIAEHAELYDYSEWVMSEDESDLPNAEGVCIERLRNLSNECGTTGCVAGHAAAMFGERLDGRIRSRAAISLDLRPHEVNFLFHGEDGFGLDAIDLNEPPADDPKGHAEALRRLDKIIEHYEAKGAAAGGES